jgi:uncharacterized SAM-binding protein YcdF (DUF218 family)
VDKAIEFWKKQKDQGGKEAVLIPSGGQGRNEPMAEAEAMGRYLRECGIPEQAILQEEKSRNTYQNMEFSKKLIDHLYNAFMDVDTVADQLCIDPPFKSRP